MRGFEAHCAQPITLHSYAPRHRSIAVKASPIGTRLGTSVRNKMVGNLTIDGEKQQLVSRQILLHQVLNVQAMIHSRNAQQRQ